MKKLLDYLKEAHWLNKKELARAVNIHYLKIIRKEKIPPETIELIRDYLEECFDIAEAGEYREYRSRFHLAYLAELVRRPKNAYTRREIPEFDRLALINKFVEYRENYETTFDKKASRA